MRKPTLLVFAFGSASGGGSGFENLVLKAREGVLDAKVIAVVSNHEHGGVRERADHLGVPFIHFPAPWIESRYRQLAKESGAEFFALSGWTKLVVGLDPRVSFNIHPGPLPEFGGAQMYGKHIHEAVFGAYKRGEITHSAVCMHFVTAKYDDGPVFFQHEVKLDEHDTPDSIRNRVGKCELRWQPEITNLVVHREISWDGRDPDSLRYPSGYEIVRSDA